jgi:hypothetical protein
MLLAAAVRRTKAVAVLKQAVLKQDVLKGRLGVLLLAVALRLVPDPWAAASLLRLT